MKYKNLKKNKEPLVITKEMIDEWAREKERKRKKAERIKNKSFI